ncbi:MAG: hypothetical protein ON057_001990 [Glomeribacter sp. 1016415]|nr:hypothetical protein [Glomeribacter sp. 1016415]
MRVSILDAKYVAEQKKLTEENALSNSLLSWGATVISNTFTSDKDTLDTLSPELQKNMKLNIK